MKARLQMAGMGSALERQFALLWRVVQGPALEREVKFDPSRRWRLDFVHVETRIAFEVEGGIWTGGRHSRGGGFCADCEKYNAATMAGWRVMRLTGEMLTWRTVHALAGWVWTETARQRMAAIAATGK